MQVYNHYSMCYWPYRCCMQACVQSLRTQAQMAKALRVVSTTHAPFTLLQADSQGSRHTRVRRQGKRSKGNTDYFHRNADFR